MIEYYELHQALVLLSSHQSVDTRGDSLRYAVEGVLEDVLMRFCRRAGIESPGIDFVADIVLAMRSCNCMEVTGEAYLFADGTRSHAIHSFVMKVHGGCCAHVADSDFEIAIKTRPLQKHGHALTDALDQYSSSDVIVDRFSFVEMWVEWYGANIQHYLSSGHENKYIVDDFIRRLCCSEIAGRFLDVVKSLPDWLEPEVRERVKSIEDTDELLTDEHRLLLPSNAIASLKAQFVVLKKTCMHSTT